jgi:hypothetical protein
MAERLAGSGDERRHVKVHFDLVQDEYGYPPSASESLWALQASDSTFELDNIPFFARGVSCHDLVSAEVIQNGHYQFVELLQEGGHSTLRVLPISRDQQPDVTQMREKLRNMGCTVELFGSMTLLAVDVPPELPISRVRELLNSERGWDYEESSLASVQEK